MDFDPTGPGKAGKVSQNAPYCKLKRQRCQVFKEIRFVKRMHVSHLDLQSCCTACGVKSKYAEAMGCVFLIRTMVLVPYTS